MFFSLTALLELTILLNSAFKLRIGLRARNFYIILEVYNDVTTWLEFQACLETWMAHTGLCTSLFHSISIK